jgi:naphthoate synthase
VTEEYEDIRYEVEGRTAIVTIDRPHRYNAFRGKTVEELIGAFRTAWADTAVHRNHPHRSRREGLLHRR